MIAYTFRRVVLLALAAVALSACGGDADDAAAATATQPVSVGQENLVVVRAQPLTSGPAFSGTLRHEREASVRSQMAGSVLQTYVDQGQSVAAGTVLARIEAGGSDDAYLSARSAVTAAENSYSIANRELERARRLHEAGAIAERELEMARAAVTNSRAMLADARARMASAAKQLGNTTVRAPFAGVIGQKSVSAGDVVQPGTLLYTVVDPGSMRLEAAIPVEQLTDVRVGLPVKFTVSGYGTREFLGRVTRVSPVVDPVTRQVQIVASIPNAGRALVGGLQATGRLSTSTRNGLVAPDAAIDERGSAPAALRVKRGIVERVSVALGARDEAGELVEITAGLLAGDTLLIGAARGITPGTPVRIVAAIGDTALRPAPPAPAAPAGGANQP
ncbi:MAG: efflux RND transporter periplasmic adaptor subunit [Gemmatimonadaceae bacterium]